MISTIVAQLSDEIQGDLWSKANAKFGEDCVFWTIIVLGFIFVIFIFLKFGLQILNLAKGLFTSKIKITDELEAAPAIDSDSEQSSEVETAAASTSSNSGAAALAHPTIEHDINSNQGEPLSAVRIITQATNVVSANHLVDRYVAKIHNQFGAAGVNPNDLMALFNMLKSGLERANAQLNFETAKGFICEGRWNSMAGDIPQIRRQMMQLMNAYAAMGKIFYDKCVQDAREHNLDERIVQDGIWDELSSNEQLPIIIFGTMNRKFEFTGGKSMEKGKEGSFYSFIGSTDCPHQFSIPELIYMMLANTHMSLSEIVEFAHALHQSRAKR